MSAGSIASGDRRHSIGEENAKLDVLPLSDEPQGARAVEPTVDFQSPVPTHSPLRCAQVDPPIHVEQLVLLSHTGMILFNGESHGDEG